MIAFFSVLNPNYKVPNLFAYNFAGFACVAFAVFLLSSQPFYLSQVMKLRSSVMGSTIGTLGVVDELTAIVVAPVTGTLIDILNRVAWRHKHIPSGTRLVGTISFCLIFVSLCSYGTWASNVFPDLWISRSVFAVGVTGVMSTVLVLLHEASFSDFEWSHFIFWRGPRTRANSELSSLLSNLLTQLTNTGKLSAILGVSTGIGAIFSVSFFLTLPNTLGRSRPDSSSSENLRLAYVVIGCFALISAFALLGLSYDCISLRRSAGRISPVAESSRVPYFETMKQGLDAAIKSRSVRVAYCGALVSRATSVAIAVFVPFLVFKFYNATGQCGSSTPDSSGIYPLKDSCKKGFIFLAVLTGVAQTVALLLTPMWGVLVDSKRFGSVFSLMAASILGVIGSFGLCLLGVGSNPYDPRNVWCYLAVSLIACSQIGIIISSMSILSTFGREKTEEDPDLIGSVTGFYHLSGGIGILLLSKIGGSWSDRWIFGPFFVLGIFNLGLTTICAAKWRKD